MNEYHDGRGRFCSGSGAVPCPDPPCEAYDGTNAGGTTQHGRASSPSPRKIVGEAKEYVDGRGGGGAPAKRRINPSPGGGGKITFANDVPGGPSTDHPISASTASMIEDVARQFGLSINVNSTIGGTHIPGSRHYQGRAVDINKVNVIPVSPSNPYVSTLQELFQKHPNIEQNFGPDRCVKKSKDGRVISVPSVKNQHRTHIHISGQE